MIEIKWLIFIRKEAVQDINKLQNFLSLYSNRWSLESKQTASTRKVYVIALVKIPAKKGKNTLNLAVATKIFLKEHMDKPSDKMLRLLLDKIWNKNMHAEEGKCMLYESSELKNKVVRIWF